MKTFTHLLLFLFTCHFAFCQEVSYTSNGQYTVPTGVSEIWIEVVGAGGHGGGNGLSGGGGGGYALGKYSVTPGQSIDITVAEAGTAQVTSVGDLISASSGTTASFSRDDDGYGLVGTGGTGNNGNIANHTGGNGGKGYWTYYGGGGGGAAGPNGNGKNGGDTHPYVSYASGGCSHQGGSIGSSGGFPGGNGGKGAGYDDCQHNTINPSSTPNNYGGGGGGGNGNGYPRTEGANGFARISTNSLANGVTQIGLTLHANDTESTYQWVDNNGDPINGEVNRSFKVTQAGSYAVELTSNGITRTSSSFTFTLDDITNNSEFYGATTYEANGSYIHNNAISNEAFIEVVGAGGDGGGNGLSGGGGGGYARGKYTISPEQTLEITIAEGGTSNITSVGSLISASSGTNYNFSRDADGYGIVGIGGTGSNGNIVNHTGGNGGKGYWTYYGGGGGGAAGRLGNGQNGGDTHPYSSGGCSHQGGSAGASGGLPGGNGGKGAGYDNCLHGIDNTNPSSTPNNYGGGGGGGNGSGYTRTKGADGMVRISYCDFILNINRTDNTLSLINSGDFSYMWVKITDSNIEYLSSETSNSFEMPQTTDSYALYAYSDICSFISQSYKPLVSTYTKPTFNNNNITVYPNPADNMVNISSNEEIYNVQLISKSGIIIKEFANKTTLHVQDVPSGLYFLKITSNSGESVKKVIIR